MQWRTACAHTLPPDILSLAHRCVAECQRADRAQETAESTKKQTDTDLKMDGATKVNSQYTKLGPWHACEATGSPANQHTAAPVGCLSVPRFDPWRRDQ